MKIEIVQLENIRSHIKSTVPFTRALTVLLVVWAAENPAFYTRLTSPCSATQ